MLSFDGDMTTCLNFPGRAVFYRSMNFTFPDAILRRSLSFILLSACIGMGLVEHASGREYLVYYGTYTGAKSKGIYVSRFDADTGKLAAAQLAAEIPSPSFLAVHPGNRFLYAVNEVSKYDGKAAGSVSAFSIDATSGKLALLNTQSSGGPGPCHLVVDKAGRHVLVANYGGGSVGVLPITKSGSLEAASAFVQHAGSSVNKSRQEAPHAHGIYLDGRNRFAYVPDLGLDQVLIYRFDTRKGTLTPNVPPFGALPDGSGPRHFALHPGGEFAYVINERLTEMVEHMGILTQAQGGFRQNKSTDINACKLYGLTKEAQRRKQRFLRADIDFKSAFNSMSQASLWAILEVYNILSSLHSSFPSSSMRSHDI